ncbi:oxidative stress-induced growth inhibitor 2 isoform X2 [Gouania willdenowi]|nr:oxidative stress-induced growth inhibitor 2 isoform X2 [Gouania willdenowi]XP_028327156.1 oxidative stress-induced growth inhibitor 2 isoform X2 [Gouania willdenowi]XP_028327157.1 oxidative stress-induced growth inhibitor 2 isoform X2 [Gouania willdenowi]XP_028327158.1 oxidative stress-induced growth inhibitor 2 isoform X2 [Gouania willdenowi]
MPLLEESTLSQDQPPTIPVVIIGNGPSGICLSYLLSGYKPYLDSATVHPNPILYRKLQETKHLPITEQDLEYLSEGLEGRSNNPVAVLFDTLLHPNADFGYEFPPVLQWRRDQKQHIPHLVLGKATPGGAWHAMEGSMLTISLGIWMELPGVNFRDLTNGKRRDVTIDRATPEEISSYYCNYVKLKGLQKNFVDNTYVTSIQKLGRGHEKESLENGHTAEGDDGGNEGFEKNGGSSLKNVGGPSLWEVRGYQQVQNGTHAPFSLFTENVVLATGASDSPVRLGVEGEDLPFVFHSISNLGLAVSQGKLDNNSDPILIVGAGLSAADAVLCACNSNIRVLHVFRKTVDDPDLIFKQLPKTLYPEYHKVYNIMSSHSFTDVDNSSTAVRPQAGSIASTVCAKMCPKPQLGSSNMAADGSVALFPDYTSFPDHCVLSFQSDMKCLLQGNNSLKAFKISMALVLIGTNPNLFFLKGQGQYLGQDPTKPISCKQNPIDIDPYTFECAKEPGLFAMGPLVGDNFVRFLKGGALGITSCLLKRLKNKGKIISNRGSSFI